MLLGTCLKTALLQDEDVDTLQSWWVKKGPPNAAVSKKARYLTPNNLHARTERICLNIAFLSAMGSKIRTSRLRHVLTSSKDTEQVVPISQCCCWFFRRGNERIENESSGKFKEGLFYNLQFGSIPNGK